MTRESANREKGRAIFLAAIMVLSVVAMSAAFAGTAAAEIDSAERTIDSTTVEAGSTVTVTVTINADEGENPFLTENFDPAFESVEMVSSETTSNGLSGANDANTQLTVGFAADSATTYTATYEVTVPSDAEAGDEFEITGTADDVTVTGDSTITVEEPPDEAEVTFTDQPSLGDDLLVDSYNFGPDGESIAIWSTNEDGEPDEIVAQKTSPTSADNALFDISAEEYESGTFVAAIHDSTTPAADNIVDKSSADITFVEGDKTVSDTTGVPTHWQGQVVVLEGDFTAGDDYQIRTVEREERGQFIVQSPPVQEVRATSEGTLIVRTQFLSADNFIVEDDNTQRSPGDEIGDSLNQYDGFAWEVAVQDLEADILNDDDTVRQGDDLDVELQSNRAGFTGYFYAINQTSGEDYYLGARTDISNFEELSFDTETIPDADHDDPLPTHDDYMLYVVVDDTTAEATDTFEVVPETTTPIVGSTFTKSNYVEATGDELMITVEMTPDYEPEVQYYQSYILVGGPDNRIMDLVKVEDRDRDGQVTLNLNSWKLARGADDYSEGYSIIDPDPDDDLVDRLTVTRPRYDNDGYDTSKADSPPDFDEPPVDGINTPLKATSYQLTAMEGETEQTPPRLRLSEDETELEFPEFTDAATLVLEDRQIEDDSIDVWVSPDTTSTIFDTMVDSGVVDLGDLSESTQLESDNISSDVVAEGDTVVLEIEATGLEGYVDDVSDLLGPNGVHLFVGQEETPADGDRFYWDLENDAALLPSPTDTYYVAVDTSNVEGIGTRSGESAPLTNYEAHLVIAGGNEGEITSYADFYEEGDFPDDENFDDTRATRYQDAIDESDTDELADYEMFWHPYFSQSEYEMSDGNLQLQERFVSFDQFVGNADEIRLIESENATVSGSTNVAPGDTFRVSLQNTTAGFNRNVLVTVDTEDGERVWNTEVDLAGVAGTSFEAQALQQGVSITTLRQATSSTATGASIAGQVITPADINITTFDAPSNVLEGRAVTASATIENTGGESVTETLEWVVAGDTVKSEEITLDAGESVDVEFTISTEGIAPGDYEHSLMVGGVSESATLTIDEDTTRTPRPTATDTIAPPPTATPTEASTPTPEEVTVVVTETVEVTQEPTEEPTTTEGGDGPGFGIAVALVALLAAAFLAVRRQD